MSSPPAQQPQKESVHFHKIVSMQLQLSCERLGNLSAFFTFMTCMSASLCRLSLH